MSSQLGFVFTADPDRCAPRQTAPAARAGAPRRPGEAGAVLPLDRRLAQLALPIHAAAADGTPAALRGQSRLEAVLRDLLGPRVIVTLTANRSTMLSYKRRRGVLYVRAHAMFADASREVLAAVASFVSDGRPNARESKLIDDYVELHKHHIRRDERPRAVQPRGEVHDLGAMLDRLNREYFHGEILAEITWSRATRRSKRRSSIRMGSYCEETGIIRIHPALDQDFVPDFFVESVVFHEMLHEHYGVEDLADGRRCVHTPELLAHEQRYARYGDARRWERANLGKLLRY